eukprot:3931961-Amphidinium_carterae.1
MNLTPFPVFQVSGKEATMIRARFHCHQLPGCSDCRLCSRAFGLAFPKQSSPLPLFAQGLGPQLWQ